MNKITQKIKEILHYGQLESMSHTQNRKIFNVNSASLIAIFSSLTYTFNLYFFIGSNVALSASLTASVAFSIWVINGALFNLHYYFVLFAIAPLLFFNSKDWYALLFFYFINIGFFMKVEYLGIDTLWEIAHPIDSESPYRF